MKKRFLIFTLILIMLFALSADALAVVDQSKEFYVADYANVYTPDFEQRIIDLNGDLEYFCDGAQIVVVTVDYLDGMYSDEYAMKLFNTWGVGSAKENNGMLLLLAIKENKAWLTVGKGISLTEDAINDMFEKRFWSPFDAGEYQEATEAMLSLLVGWYIDEYDLHSEDELSVGNGSMQETYRAYEEYRREENKAMLIRLLIVLVIVFIVYSMRDRRKYRNYYSEMHMPMPRYHFWYMFGGPHIRWYNTRWDRYMRSSSNPGQRNNDRNFYGGNSSQSSGSSFGGFGGHSGFGGGHSGSGFGGGGFGGHGGGRR